MNCIFNLFKHVWFQAFLLILNRYDLSTEAMGFDWNCGSGADGECGMNGRGGVALGEDVFFFLVCKFDYQPALLAS